MEHIDSCRWRKSSYSGNGGADCVEVGAREEASRVFVRDTKDPQGPLLAFGPDAWKQFAERVKAGARSV
jgi:hypothetical protein